MSKSLPSLLSTLMRSLKTLLLPFLFTLISFAAVSQTVTSDKDDYSPGEIAKISGEGWTNDDSVKIIIDEEPAWDYGHQYYAKVTDGKWSIDFPIEIRHVGVKFYLTVVGMSTGSTASHSFTDAVNMSISGNAQPANTVCAGQNIILQSFIISNPNAASGQIDGFAITLGGTYVSSDISNYKVYMTSGSTFTSPQELVVLPASGPGSKTINFTTSGIIPANSSSYFWLTVDISSSSAFGKTFTAGQVRRQDIIDDNNNNVNSGGPAPASGTQTIRSNTAPSFTSNNPTVSEDGGAQILNNWATITQGSCSFESSQSVTFTITGNTNPSLFSVAPQISSNGTLSFTPASNANGTANITVTITDDGGTANGGVNQSSQQFSITVNSVNDAPSFTKGEDQTVLEDAGAQSVPGWATAISVGPANEAAQTVSFEVTNNTNPSLFSSAPTVSATGVLSYTPAANASGLATITLKIRDDGGTTNGGVDQSATQTFVINVNSVNDAPGFTKGGDQTVLEDAGAQSVNAWATSISAGPADESAQSVIFEVTNNTNPSLFSSAPAVSATGVLNYTPAANANGTATITLKINDNGGTANGGVDASTTQTFVINVTSVNDAPSFTKGVDQITFEDIGAKSITGWASAISAGPADESAQILSFVVTDNTNPSLFAYGPNVSVTGTLSYGTAPNAFGSATITIKITDNGGTDDGGVNESATQTFVINVNSVNDAPSFTKGEDQTVLEDAGVQIVPAWATAISAGPANESDQTVSFEIMGNTNPSLFSSAPAISPTGELSYTPAANANGTATISITIKDNGGGHDMSSIQTFVINVTSVNDAPGFTKGGDQTVLEDAGAQTIPGWATAISAGPADESVQTVNFEVTNNTNPSLFSSAPVVSATGVLSYTPAANANGTATITLKIKDNGGTANGGVDESATQTFVINVTSVNDAPSFTKGDDQTVLEDAGAQSVPGWATSISAGPADESVQTVSFEVTGNTNPSLFSSAPAVSATGELSYTPAANANGTATITIKIKDNGGNANGGVDESATQTFVINVTSVNDAPSFTKGGDQTVLEDAGAQSVNAWATAISAGPANESAQTVSFEITGNTNASLFSSAPAVSATGELSYTPAANANGSATITLKIKDNGETANGGVDESATQTFVINVTSVNDAPSFTKGGDQTVLEDAGAQSVTGWATAISAGPANESAQTVSFEITGNTNASLFSSAPAVSATGELSYTPAANANGSATITIKIKDNGGNANGGVDESATQTFVISVTSVNDAPSFTKGGDQTVLEDAGAQSVNAWATAISAGPANESAQTVNFEVTNNTNPSLFSSAPVVSATGVLSYTPAANANGTATITIKIKDNGGTANGGVDESATQTFVINVTSVNDAPSFTKGGDQTVLEDAGAQSVNAWATAISAGPANESAQTVSFEVTGNTNPSLFSSAPAVSATGELSYTPAANANGTATITIKIKDNGGNANGGVDESATQTFVINVTSVNDAPSFTKGGDQTVLEDAGAQSVNAWATAISAGPANESAQTVSFEVTGNTNASLFSSAPAVSATGELSYTPAANANGSATITIKIKDNGGTANGGVDQSATQTFVINVTSVNDAPSFTKGGDQTVLEDAGAQSVNAWATAISAGPANESAQTVSFEVTGNTNASLFSSAPAVSATGVLSYTPAANANGTATITLKIKDNGGTANGGVDESVTQTFVINVTAVNDAPVVTINAGTTQSLQYSDQITDIAFTSSDIDNSPASLNASTSFTFNGGAVQNGLPTGLSLAKVADGSWEIKGKMMVQPGVYVINCKVSDGDLTTTKTATITVTKENAVAYNNTNPMVFTSSTSTPNASVQLLATINDITFEGSGAPNYDANGGDIKNAVVRFIVVNDSEVPVAGSPFTGTFAGYNINGNLQSASFSTGSITLPAGTSSTTYKVRIEIDGYYTGSDGNYMVTVALPIQNEFVTGGGYIINNNVGGSLAAIKGSRTNFGFNVKYNKSGSNPQGKFTSIVRAANGKTYQIKSTNYTNFGATQYSTDKIATANLQSGMNMCEILPDGTLSTSCVSGTLVVDFRDAGEPGVNDYISITARDKNGALLYSNNWSNGTFLSKLAGGNIVIRGGAVINSSAPAVTQPIIIPSGGSGSAMSGVGNFAPAEIKSSIYPNPSTNVFKLTFSTESREKLDITVMDISGRTVKSYKTDPTGTFSFGESLRPGLYMILVKQGALSKVFKVVKQ
jgi:hypothetical protein